MGRGQSIQANGSNLLYGKKNIAVLRGSDDYLDVVKQGLPLFSPQARSRKFKHIEFVYSTGKLYKPNKSFTCEIAIGIKSKTPEQIASFVVVSQVIAPNQDNQNQILGYRQNIDDAVADFNLMLEDSEIFGYSKAARLSKRTFVAEWKRLPLK